MDQLKTLAGLCKGSVHVALNAHRDCYESVESSLESAIRHQTDDAVSDAEVRRIMIETDTMVEVQCYPNTPIGCVIVRHHDLDAALDEAINEVKACVGPKATLFTKD